MELYIGGRAQGKTAYVLKVRGIPKERVWDDFSEWFRGELLQGRPAEQEAREFLDKHPDTAVICDEVGCGVVPLDAKEREFRERLGHFQCEIAARSERVERILCGIGQRIR